MEILLWLVPPVVVTGIAMVWVSWLGRTARHEVDREVAVQRLARALEPRARRWARARRPGPRYDAPRPPADRSSNVAVRPSASSRRVPPRPGVETVFPVSPVKTPTETAARAVRPTQPRPRRRAS